MIFRQGDSAKMVDTQHFCLRWNNYQSSITSAFENLRDDEDFVDVTLACDGRSLKAHRVVLSACSPYFRELLKSTPCKHPVIVLQDVAFTDLHALVEFIYHGEVNVHQRSLSSFLKTAEVLRVSGLTQKQAEETHSLAQVQNLTSSGGRPPVNHHQSFTDKLVEDALFPHGASPPPHFNNLHTPTAHSGTTVNQLLRRAAAVALRRERNNSNQSDDYAQKRHRIDNGILGNNNSPDVINHMPQITATDFSTSVKHNNNNTPPLKENDRNDNGSNNQSGNSLNTTGNGLGSTGDKDSLTPSPPTTRVHSDDVKAEPMELVCGNNNTGNDDQSNDSVPENDINHSGNMSETKGHISSPNEDDLDNSIHSHTAPPFLMSDSKLFPTPGSFNFPISALTDPSALAGFNSQALHSAVDLAGSPQGPQSAVVSVGTSASSSTTASSGSQLRMPPPTSGGINEPQECPYCHRTFSCYYSLKRHFQDKHEQSDTLYVCEFCHRRYRTKNSLTTHKSLQHRGSSGMLKRLLKTSAIKNVLGPHHAAPHPRPHLFDFAAELGQPPPGIQ
ncbi:broad-complex core protein isoforms 1/2/3/4/5 isoform X3 [Lutzomyia longipalpis]|uniref:broad-complex core protein isoforms 1/2/3/4/5 isoform X3 n=1 Tax=Lutzomyia longipalpis TaxID=7200 RepID=UPI0024835107|nr:broad-complex core protein isoforms 1/2/3/4/5 isoform X3 [Lutzomyia longipalpis]